MGGGVCWRTADRAEGVFGALEDVYSERASSGGERDGRHCATSLCSGVTSVLIVRVSLRLDVRAVSLLPCELRTASLHRGEI